MLPREENELFTRIGPGTPMGSTLRATGSPPCSPESCRARLPARARQAAGRGPRRLPRHRRAASAWSTSSARTGALRCSSGATRSAACAASITAGSSTSTATASTCRTSREERSFKHKIRITAYPTVELGGIVWAYIGPAEQEPPPPEFAWTQVPETPPHVSKVIGGVQLAAGAGGRHRHLARADPAPPSRPTTRRAAGIKPIEPVRARQGADARRRRHRLRLPAMPASGRSDDADVHIRSYHFVMPFHQIRPSRSELGLAARWPGTSGCRWMTTTRMVYNWMYRITDGR